MAAPRTSEVGVPVFEVDRFAVVGSRLEVDGRWFGVRGRRFVRPTLEVPGLRPVLAVLDHKPWAPVEGEPWVAAFPWDGTPEDADGAVLGVGTDVAIVMPAATAEGAPPQPKPRRKATPPPPREPPRFRRPSPDAVDLAQRERDIATRARDAAFEARDAALAEREELRHERDAARRERDAARVEIEALRDDRDSARAESEPPPAPAAPEPPRAEAPPVPDLRPALARLEAERDEALRERDAARAEARRVEPAAVVEPHDVLAAHWLYRGLTIAAAIAALLLLITLLGAIF